MLEGAIREDRRTVTALSADIVGSTALSERLDTEDASAVIGGAVALIVKAVEEFGGTIASVAGDGVLALFGTPTAHEDDAERAIHAGLRIVETMAAYSSELGRGAPPTEQVEVRIGIETGPAVIGPLRMGDRVEIGATGNALNTAARLQTAAAPGIVTVGARTQRAAAPLFEWSRPVSLQLKGKAEPVVAYTVDGVRSKPVKRLGLVGPRTVPLVGRGQELAIGKAAVDAVLGGQGSLLLIRGEAGVGKSRLLSELRQIFQQAASPFDRRRWLEARCVSYGGSIPYWPIRQLLSDWLGTTPAGGDSPLPSRLRADPKGMLPERADEFEIPLALLLGMPTGAVDAKMPPDTLRRLLFEAVRAVFDGLAKGGPVVLAIDDFHWADRSSVELVEDVLPVVASAPIVLILVARPDPAHDGWLNRDALSASSVVFRDVVLEALPDRADRQLLSALIGREALPNDVEARVLQAAEGNPFYLEELVRSMVDAGALRRRDGGWSFDRNIPLEVPETIEKVILTRLDRLSPRERDVVAAASVIGRAFSVSLLQTVCATHPVQDALGTLIALDLVREDRSGEKAEHAFKHVLIQETAYRALLRRRRRELHARVAEAIDTMFVDRLEEHYAELAHHYRLAENFEKAFKFHVLAGQGAGRVYAVEEAVRHYSRALEAATALGLPESKVADVRLQRGRVHAEAGSIAEARTDFEATLHGARVDGDARSEMQALNELGFLLAGAADYRQAIPRFQESLQIAERLDDRAAQVNVLSRLSIAYTNRLKLDRALAYGQQAECLARELDSKAARAMAMDALLLAAVSVGDFATADAIAPQLIEIQRAQGNLWYLQFAIHQWCYVAMGAGHWQLAFDRIQEALAINRRIGDRGNEPIYDTTRCCIHRNKGEFQKALSTGQRAVGLADELGHPEWLSWASFELAATLVELGLIDEALLHLKRGIDAAERSGATNHLIRCAGYLAWAETWAGNSRAGDAMRKRSEELLSEVTAPAGRAFLEGAQAYTGLARAHLAEGEGRRAEELLIPILSAAEASGWQQPIAEASLLIGSARAAGKDAGGAEPLLQRAVTVATGAHLDGLTWQAHAALARLYGETGRRELVAGQAARARAIVGRLAGGIEDSRTRERFLSVAIQANPD